MDLRTERYEEKHLERFLWQLYNFKHWTINWGYLLRSWVKYPQYSAKAPLSIEDEI